MRLPEGFAGDVVSLTCAECGGTLTPRLSSRPGEQDWWCKSCDRVRIRQVGEDS